MNEFLFPFRQADHFSEVYLVNLFRSGILKSAAVGRDGVRPATFAKQLEDEARIISRKVQAGTYAFTRFRERLILRGASRPPRQISIPSVRDRLTLRATCNALSIASPQSIPAPPHTHIKKIVDAMAGVTEPMSFVRIDVKNFYPSIRHADLANSLKEIGLEPFLVKLIMDSVTTATGDCTVKPSVGVPQGLSISNILSGIYMKEYDKLHDGVFCRYVDDILTIVPSHQSSRAFKDEYDRLGALGLTAHPPETHGKSIICRLSEGVEYLGYSIKPGKVSIRNSSYRRMFANLLRVITNFKYRKKADQFITKMNLKITGCIVDGKRRGWLLFFSQTQDIAQLKYLDKFVTQQLNKLGFIERQSEIKRFVRAYHEIRFNGCAGGYIPNFDTFDDARKREFLATISSITDDALNGMTPEELDIEFRKAVAREVQDLEKDVIDAFS